MRNGHVTGWQPTLKGRRSNTIRASTINTSHLAIRIKIIYCYLVGGERGGERR
jgi:hypothetical protein